ncbi:MAG: cytochrome b/b6 domain-containing protein [Maritimibacter sp.]|nr:cytochrome b/b6 domain-containing protein [Maritimibacter sp.]
MRTEVLSETGTRTGIGAQSPASAAHESHRVWDPLVRLVHWGVAGAVLLNATVIDKESTAHETIGYIAVGLVAARLVWGLIGTRHARLTSFPPNPVAAVRHLAGLIAGRHRLHLSHNPAGALMVYNLWATLLGMGVTGYMMGTRAYFGMEWVEELHEGLFTWLMISVGLHLLGVLADSLATRVNLVRAMVDGRKRVPPGSTAE